MQDKALGAYKATTSFLKNGSKYHPQTIENDVYYKSETYFPKSGRKEEYSRT
jgi:hypothetical protein